MINTLKTIMGIRSASGANRLLYYLKGFPVIGKRIKDEVYSWENLKKALALIVTVLKVLWGFLNKFAYLGLVIYWPLMLLSSGLTPSALYQQYLHVLVVISFLVAPVSSAVIMEPKRDKYICVKLMRLPAASYMRSTMAQRGLTFLLYFIPAATVFAHLLDAPVWQGLVLALLLAAWRMGAEAVHLWIFDKYGIVLVKKTAVVWTVMLAGYALAYGPPAAGVSYRISDVLFSLPVIAAVLLIGAAGSLYIARYPGYRRAVDAVTKMDDPLLDLGRMMQEARVKEVETKEQDFSKAQLSPGNFQDKSGYAYLNAIFFSRHRRFLIQPIQRRLFIIGGLFAAGLAVMMISPAVFARLAQFLISGLPFFIIIMNFCSIGERVCKAMFYNCDLSLLRYGFYRERPAVISNFRIRLLRISGLNLIPAAAICLAVNLLILLSGEVWSAGEAAVFSVTVLGLSLFFSVHHLFMYYIFQPYTTELNVKNPFFSIVNSLVLAVGVICANLQSVPAYFAGAVLLSTIVYILAALVLVFRYSSKTFRVK
ncbi:hypothetical protein C2I18_20645 [Paenibacillus sp. PK3_47]|uniref:hypothetical protein n=1 Tax=Paenibacillus sp. PK3_47 TaxID=2072642 RepID=UPI00201D7648|nr:hypothetical protein [Paenibacillus sp. PK3_47]UQZ35721.1 hypothetical protein C2I18_20645 [Paenibacillus sp. PK3_47]